LDPAADAAAAADTTVAAGDIASTASAMVDWLGPDARVIANGAGDKVFVSSDGTRRIRFDINNPYPHDRPHSHVQQLINGQWVKSGPIYPSDVPAH